MQLVRFSKLPLHIYKAGTTLCAKNINAVFILFNAGQTVHLHGLSLRNYVRSDCDYFRGIGVGESAFV
jgi:hypothetical protein